MADHALPDDACILLDRARSALAHSDHQSARDIMRQVLASYPANATVCHVCGGLLFEIRDYQAAVAAFRLELDPENAETHRNLGMALGLNGNPSDALAEFERAIDLKPDFALGYYEWGMLLKDEQDHWEAIAKLRQPTELDPDLAPAYQNWARVMCAQGDFEGAVAKLVRATEVDPTYPEAWLTWANTEFVLLDSDPRSWFVTQEKWAFDLVRQTDPLEHTTAALSQPCSQRPSVFLQDRMRMARMAFLYTQETHRNANYHV